MQLGGTFVDVISDGTILIDGGSVFGQVPKSEWELYIKPDRKNRVRLGLNCLLIRSSSGNILINTGAGSKRLEKLKESHGLQGNKLIKGLKALGVSARDIDTVVLTDLQFDTSGGLYQAGTVRKGHTGLPEGALRRPEGCMGRGQLARRAQPQAL